MTLADIVSSAAASGRLASVSIHAESEQDLAERYAQLAPLAAEDDRRPPTFIENGDDSFHSAMVWIGNVRVSVATRKRT